MYVIHTFKYLLFPLKLLYNVCVHSRPAADALKKYPKSNGFPIPFTIDKTKRIKKGFKFLGVFYEPHILPHFGRSLSCFMLFSCFFRKERTKIFGF